MMHPQISPMVFTAPAIIAEKSSCLEGVGPLFQSLQELGAPGPKSQTCQHSGNDVNGK